MLISNKNIILFLPISPSLNAGGSKHGLSFGIFLKNKSISLSLAIIDNHENDKLIPLEIINIPYFKHCFFYKLISFLFLVIPKYIQIIIKYDIIFIYGGDIIGWELIILFTKLLKKKKIIFRSTLLNSDDVQTLTKPLVLGNIRKYLLKNIYMYFSINSAFTLRWKNIFNKTNNVLQSPQGVNSNLFKPCTDTLKLELRKFFSLPLSTPIIISVGYIIERKGFVNTFKALANIDIPFIYIIIGEYYVDNNHYMHEYKNEMIEIYKAGKKFLKDKLIFLGPQTQNVISKYLMISDLFILASNQEGLPNALLEAMSTGLCCAVNDIEGLKNFIPNNCFLNFYDISSLRSLVIDILNNTDKCKKIGINARNWIVKEASFEAVYNKLINYNI